MILLGVSCASFALLSGFDLATAEDLAWQESPVKLSKDVELKVPPEFGNLVAVTQDSEIHHLYFQDSQGTIRIVRVGQPGASVKSRRPMDLLSPTVHVLNRGPAKVEESSAGYRGY
ncbi:MAG: hypothetical protein JW937_06440 [Candidatus Omnitrophica bacterium]|nr:hypothetical protein [Candidatus Omnitrophota bacterium]